ncbi:MAG TPA: tyrosine-protein phosphatase [Dehalococcoidia bacterium]|nr:tyrosine-protein phosphatase [Dehalococcoidia bacterium]
MRWDDIRPVELPPSVPGQLFLMAMPGRQRPLQLDVERALALGVTGIVSLAPPDEVADKSPEYAEAIAAGRLPFPVESCPIDNGGVPRDPEAFRRFLQRTAQRLRQGERLLLHCAAGVGRTGTAAVGVLLALGVGLDEALDLVRRAGSYPETAEQHQLVRWLAESGLG